MDGWESLRPYTLCVARGMKVAERGTESGFNRLLVTGAEQMVLMLKAGRCQGSILGHPIWLEIDRLHAGPLREPAPPVERVPLFHYLHRSHAALAPELAKALRAMADDGAAAAILLDLDQAIAAAKARNSVPEP